MLNKFDNETENGKLYISYPMVEALKHIKKDNLGINHNILYYKVKRHVSFLAYSHIEKKLLDEKVVIIR